METPDADPRSSLTEALAAGADLIYGGFVLDSGGPRVIQAMYDEGLFDEGIKFMGPDGIFSPALIDQVGDPAVLEGNTYYTFPGLLPSLLTNDQGVRFYTDYVAAHNEEPDPYSVYAYAAAQSVLAAFDTASETELNRANVLQALADLEDYEGIIGAFGFDDNGDNTNAAFVGYDFADGNFANPVPITPTMHEDCGG